MNCDGKKNTLQEIILQSRCSKFPFRRVKNADNVWDSLRSVEGIVWSRCYVPNCSCFTYFNGRYTPDTWNVFILISQHVIYHLFKSYPLKQLNRFFPATFSIHLCTHNMLYHHHHVPYLTIRPYPPPKRVLYKVRPSASAFIYKCPHASLRLSNSCLHLLPCVPVISILPPPFSFNNVY
jgi:hypothetical protein